MSINDATIPGKSLDAQFDLVWQRFERIQTTVDSINHWSMRVRRWLTPINVSFVIPIDDPRVCDYLGEAQQVMLQHMAYAPQPADKLHITLYQVGYLRRLPLLRLPGSWSRTELNKIAETAQQYLTLLKPFLVEIGPINAFPNVAIAEVRDGGRLRLLRGVVSRAIPPLITPLNFPLIPHTTLGYFGKQPAEPIRNRLRVLRNWPRMQFEVRQVEMTLYKRKPGPYEPRDALVHSEQEVLYKFPMGNS
jgi:2'-5' RNA ligase